MKSNKQKLGYEVENLVKNYLLQNGMFIVQSNYTCKYGEIDLIASEQDVLVFVEVRYRKNEDYGGAIASITKSKQSKIIRASKAYLLEKNLYDKVACRFDVAIVQDNFSNNHPKNQNHNENKNTDRNDSNHFESQDEHQNEAIVWLKNAFLASSW